MLYTESQNQFKDSLEANLKGAPLNLGDYQADYLAWSKTNETVLPHLNMEERTVAFSDDLEDKVQAEQRKIIDESEQDPSKRKKLYQQVQRGQLMLTSTDGGKTFDKVLSVHEAQKIGPLTLRFKSPTLRSSTTNVEEVAEEQEMLHAVRKLRKQHFLVERAWVENHTVHVAATHPRRGTYEVTVPLDQDSTLPLIYKFENQEGVKQVAETQLPEEFGEAARDPSLIPVDARTLWLQETNKTVNRQNERDAELLRKATLAGSLALYGAQNWANQNAADRAALEAQRTREHMKSPVVHHDVMASKAAFLAHKARQDQQAKGEQERMAQRETEKEKSAQKALQQKQQKEVEERQKAQMEANAKGQRKLKWGSWLAGLSSTGATTATFLFLRASET